MTEYFLHCDEPHWVTTVWNEEMTELNEDREITDIMEDTVCYYWIKASDREDVLKVNDFIMGEEVIKKLSEGTLESFEDAEKQYEYAEIKNVRPPQ